MEGETKTCIKCGEVKTVDLFDKSKNLCKECRKEYQKERYKERRKDPAFRERKKEYSKEYDKERRKDPAAREHRKEYEKERYRTDPEFRLARNLRNRIRSALKAQSAKKLHSFNKLLGCTPAEARAHITAQFKPGMTWDNYCYEVWQIDHIRPLDSFDLTDPQQQLDANHYTNLQPLWGPENLAKGAKWEPTEEVTDDQK